MLFSTLTKYSRLALCVAILFVATNVAHAAEHDFSTEVTQGHVECLHCIDEQPTLVGASVPTEPFSLVSLLNGTLWLKPLPTATYFFRARAPPVS